MENRLWKGIALCSIRPIKSKYYAKRTNARKFLPTVLFVFLVTTAFSQVTGGLDLAVPSGNWSNGWGAGFGVSGRYEAPFQDKLNWTVSVGFLSFSGKTTSTIIGYAPGNGLPVYSSISFPAQTVVPITGGLKYYFQKSNNGFHGTLDIGLFIGNNGVSTKVGFSPALGYRLAKFDFTVSFNAVSDLNYGGLRAAYIFPGKLK